MSWLIRALFDWVFVLFFGLLQGLLYIVGFVEKFFDLFAGTAKVLYKGNADFLINIFFAHDGVGNAFWAMALIAIVMSFGFCIVSVSRKITDVTGSVKQSLGQIFSNFIRCTLIILMLNAVALVTVNASNVLLDRINFALLNSQYLNKEDSEKTFSEQEYAAMTKILATVANYSVNPSSDSRYNINSCFNSVRQDLLALYVSGFFDYNYMLDDKGHNSWQSALQLLANSADLTTDLSLDTYYAETARAFNTIVRELKTNPDFAPVKTAQITTSGTITTDNLIFLISSIDAANNTIFNGGSMDDALRRGYVQGNKSYMNLGQVRADFDIWLVNYFVGYVSSITFILIMLICIFTFIVRLFNLLLLYLTAPLFVSSMPLDDGAKFQSWTQAFVIQLFSGFGSLIAMRLYLIIIPIVVSRDLVFFPESAFLSYMAQLLMILAGAWAVLKASGVITGILAGNPGMAAIQQEGQMAGAVTAGAMRATHAAGHLVKSLPGGIKKGITAPADMVNGIKNVGKAYKSAFGKEGGDARKPRDDGGEKGATGATGTTRSASSSLSSLTISARQRDSVEPSPSKPSTSRLSSTPQAPSPKLGSTTPRANMPVVNTSQSRQTPYRPPAQKSHEPMKMPSLNTPVHKPSIIKDPPKVNNEDVFKSQPTQTPRMQTSPMHPAQKSSGPAKMPSLNSSVRRPTILKDPPKVNNEDVFK